MGEKFEYSGVEEEEEEKIQPWTGAPPRSLPSKEIIKWIFYPLVSCTAAWLGFRVE